MFKSFFFSILFLFLLQGTTLLAQPEGVLAPKERDVEEVPNDSIAPAVYVGMSYEELMVVFGRLKYTESDPVDSLRAKEKKLRQIRDMAWLLVRFMEDPIKKRIAEDRNKEAQRVQLQKVVNKMKEDQVRFAEDRNKRQQNLDSLNNASTEEEYATEESVSDESSNPPENQEESEEEQEEEKKKKKKQTPEEKLKEKQKQEALKKQKEKQRQEEKLKAKQQKEQAKFMEKEQELLDASYEDSTKMVEDLQLMEDSLTRFSEELKAFEDSTELMRKNLKPVKNLAYEIRKEWVKMSYKLQDITQPLGKEASEDFDAIVTDFLNMKYDEVVNAVNNVDVLERLKTLKNNIFFSKRIPNINCHGGIGVFLQGLPEEEIKTIAGGDVGVFLKSGCVGYTMGLGEDCNLVILKLPDEQIIAVLRKKTLKQEYDYTLRKMVIKEGLHAFDAIKVIK